MPLSSVQKWIPTAIVLATALIAVGVMKAEAAGAIEKVNQVERKHEQAMSEIQATKIESARQAQALKSIEERTQKMDEKLDRLLERR